MKKVTFYGRLEVVNGAAQLTIPEKNHLAQRALEALGGECLVRITITEDDKGKDSRLQGYYWAVVLPDIAAGMRHLGNDWDKNEAHDQLKAMFAPLYNGKPTTKRMTKREFSDYVDKCVRFAAEFLNIAVRDRPAEALMPTQEPPV